MAEPTWSSARAKERLDAAVSWARAKALGGAQTLAGMAAPVPGSPAAAMVAAMRSALPGRGTYQQEMDRYNLAATEGESVTDRFQAPGEGTFDFMRRQAASPGNQREVMAGATMAAPIQLVRGGKPIVYGMEHQPADRNSGAPLSDLTGEGRIYPDDVYSRDGRRIYGTNQEGEAAIFALAQRLRGNPDATVPIYRAVPGDAPPGSTINKGDWVGVTPEYAALHGDGPLRGDYRVIEGQARAGDLFTSGDSIHEWGYDPPTVKAMTEQLRAAHPGVEFSLMPGSGGAVVLSSIKVPKEMRGKGLGEAFMSDLTALADEYGARLAASPSSDFGGSKVRIREWNKRHGFVDNKGRSKDFTLSETMYRDPGKR